jgi:hypothetical protein
MADAAEARAWLTENLTDPHREYTASSDYYKLVAAYIVGLPDDDAELIQVVGLLNSYDHGPGAVLTYRLTETTKTRPM